MYNKWFLTWPEFFNYLDDYQDIEQRHQEQTETIPALMAQASGYQICEPAGGLSTLEAADGEWAPIDDGAVRLLGNDGNDSGVGLGDANGVAAST